MAKEYIFRGKRIDDLKAMTLEELSKMLTARERRTIKRGFSDQEKKLIENIRKDPAKFHKTHVRNLIILPEMVGTRLGVFTGKDWFQLTVEPSMIGHRTGEFSIPIKRVKHSAPGIGASRGSKNIAVK
jgi:small subunit ribosomal protein S19